MTLSRLRGEGLPWEVHLHQHSRWVLFCFIYPDILFRREGVVLGSFTTVFFINSRSKGGASIERLACMDPAKVLPWCPPSWWVLEEVMHSSFSCSATSHLNNLCPHHHHLPSKHRLDSQCPFTSLDLPSSQDSGNHQSQLWTNKDTNWPERSCNLASGIGAKGISVGKGVAPIGVEVKLDLPETDLAASTSLLSKGPWSSVSCTRSPLTAEVGTLCPFGFAGSETNRTRSAFKHCSQQFNVNRKIPRRSVWGYMIAFIEHLLREGTGEPLRFKPFLQLSTSTILFSLLHRGRNWECSLSELHNW